MSDSGSRRQPDVLEGDDDGADVLKDGEEQSGTTRDPVKGRSQPPGDVMARGREPSGEDPDILRRGREPAGTDPDIMDSPGG